MIKRILSFHAKCCHSVWKTQKRNLRFKSKVLDQFFFLRTPVPAIGLPSAHAKHVEAERRNCGIISSHGYLSAVDSDAGGPDNTLRETASGSSVTVPTLNSFQSSPAFLTSLGISLLFLGSSLLPSYLYLRLHSPCVCHLSTAVTNKFVPVLEQSSIGHLFVAFMFWLRWANTELISTSNDYSKKGQIE